MQLSQEDRQKHIDLSNSCIPATSDRNWKNIVKGQYIISGASIKAKRNLLDHLSIEDFSSRKIHTCHKCKNGTGAPNGFYCINPDHLYFGTASENFHDIDKNVRKDISKSGVEARRKNRSPRLPAVKKKHSSKDIIKCPHCVKTGQKIAMYRWHFDNCKEKT